MPRNPFHQPAHQWQIRVFAARDHVPAVEEAFGDLALAMLSFEIDEANARWRIDILTDGAPPEGEVSSRLCLVAGLLGIPTPECEVSPLEQKDWIAEVEKSFTPLSVGRFYVYGSHVKTAPPQGSIPVRINAGAAFGSGEHATTSGCLLALGLLAKRRCFTHPLDMGCGSGILAIGMAKLWRVGVTGIDIDPVSVTVSRENAAHNRVTALTRFQAGDGYRTALARAGAPYDLIVANILARPLVRLAPHLAKNLAPGGVAVLSGLLGSQERMVLAAHRAQGLHLMRRICINGWNTLVLQG